MSTIWLLSTRWLLARCGVLGMGSVLWTQSSVSGVWSAVFLNCERYWIARYSSRRGVRVSMLVSRLRYRGAGIFYVLEGGVAVGVDPKTTKNCS